MRGVRTGRAGRMVAALALALHLAALPAAAPAVYAQGLDDRISEARQRQAGIQRSIERQKRLLSDLRADQSVAQTALGATDRSLDGINADQAALRKEIATATDAINDVQARRDGLMDELRQLDWTLSLLEQEIADGDRELDQRRRILGERLAQAYRTQNTSLLEQVLADGSFSDVLTEANAYLSYGDEDARMAETIVTDQRSLDALRALTSSTRYRTDRLRRDAQDAEAALRSQKERLAKAKERMLKLEAETERIQREQLREYRRLAGSAQKRREIIASAASAQRKLDRRIASLVAEARRRAEAAARAAKAARAAERRSTPGGSGGGLAEGDGRFSWPVGGYVTQEFGCTGFSWEPPRGNCANFHSAMDIANAAGTPIRAPEDGVVAFVGWNPYDDPRDPAFLVVLAHSGGYVSRLVHMQARYAVRAGQSVRKGQIVGYVGNTGRSTGYHLHWEVTRNGRLVNPRDVV